MPFPSPSIFTPAQLDRKYLASAHEVICEQYLRLSHLKPTLTAILGKVALLAAAAETAATRLTFSAVFSSATLGVSVSHLDNVDDT
jgi:hypothetical protein